MINTSSVTAVSDVSAVNDIEQFCVLGIKVNATSIADVVAQMERWIAERAGAHYIAVTGMHGISESLGDAEFARVLNSADLVVPDGMPLVWLGRTKGHQLKRRVYGPELMLEFWKQTAHKAYRHFFYGGQPGVAESLAQLLQAQFPGNQVSGIYVPPFRPLTQIEEHELAAQVASGQPDVLWVGLSTPKQERWMIEHRHLGVPVMVGVGAAFDILSGRTRQAPLWMREHGLEWFFRLTTEPRRLWRRYIVGGSKFLLYLILESMGLKSFYGQDKGENDS